MSRTPWKQAEDYDNTRQNAFVMTACGVLVMIFLFLSLRDRVWRMLHEGDLVTGLRTPSSGWTELDEELIRRLTLVEITEAEGLEQLEKAIITAINARRELESSSEMSPADSESAPGVATTSPALVPRSATALPPFDRPPGRKIPPPMASELLRDLARSRAAARLTLPPAEEVTAPELRFPEIYLALSQSHKLVRTVEVHQKLPPTAPVQEAGFAEELLSGWMNRLRFSSMVLQGEHLEIGVGVVVGETGEIWIEIILVETLLELEEALSAVARQDGATDLRGWRPDQEAVTVYFKGPSDPGFYPLEILWTGLTFAHELRWEQGSGNYALRAGRGDRLSDPRPVFVQ